jgi:translation elongation factor EF-Tu-like GTPase
MSDDVKGRGDDVRERGDDVRERGGRMAWQLERAGGLERFASFGAELELIPTDDGGRRSPVSSGYRPVALLDGESHEVAIYFDGPPTMPGQTIGVSVIPLRIDFWRRLEIGEAIPLAEGKRSIGRLIVTSTEHMPT